ncbi:MAG: hypothetical protein LBT32_06260, partial [Peptococcaceae bacterium]|nr:hypothetical protein [Peptococcaceae bacterium]
ITQNGGLIVAAIDALPDKKAFGAKFVSLLLGGEIAPIFAPQGDEITQFAHYYAARKKLVLASEVPDQLGEACANFHEVIQVIEHFIQFAEAEKEDLSWESFQRFWKKEQALQISRLTPENVLKVTSRTTEVPLEELLGAKRHWASIEARRLAVYFLRQRCQCSYNEIGRLFNRSHSSIILLFQQAEVMLRQEQRFQKRLLQIDQWFSSAAPALDYQERGVKGYGQSI